MGYNYKTSHFLHLFSRTGSSAFDKNLSRLMDLFFLGYTMASD